MGENSGSKEKILETVVELLLDGQDASKVSNRQIASIAGVNSALINYYFQSKDNLVGIAAGICMEKIAGALNEYSKDLCVGDRIKQMLKDFSDFCYSNITIAEIAINADLKQGSIHTSGIILPLFREHFGKEKTDNELKLLTFQLLHPMQLLFINRNEYKTYLSCDPSSKDIRDNMIETLVDNIFMK